MQTTYEEVVRFLDIQFIHKTIIEIIQSSHHILLVNK